MDEMDDHLNEAGVHKRLRMPKKSLYSTGFSLGHYTSCHWPGHADALAQAIPRDQGQRLRAEAQAMAEVLLPQRKDNGK